MKWLSELPEFNNSIYRTTVNVCPTLKDNNITDICLLYYRIEWKDDQPIFYDIDNIARDVQYVKSKTRIYRPYGVLPTRFSQLTTKYLDSNNMIDYLLLEEDIDKIDYGNLANYCRCPSCLEEKANLSYTIWDWVNIYTWIYSITSYFSFRYRSCSGCILSSNPDIQIINKTRDWMRENGIEVSVNLKLDCSS